MAGSSALSCPICGSANSASAFQYSTPPPGEAPYNAFAGGSYFREYFRCSRCAHLQSSFHWPKKSVYEGSYVNATYNGLEGLRKTFAKIRGLPAGKSDNTGRVGYVRANWAHYGGREVENTSVLDVGSGLGIFPFAMMESGFQITALDPDPVACQHIREDLGIKVLEGDFFKVNPGSGFHLITFNKVLEHVEDPIAMLKRAKEFLRKDEKSLVYVELPDAEAAGRDSPMREEFTIDHLHVFSFASMSLLATRAGFEVLALERLREPSSKYTLRGIFRTVQGGA